MAVCEELEREVVSLVGARCHVCVVVKARYGSRATMSCTVEAT